MQNLYFGVALVMLSTASPGYAQSCSPTDAMCYLERAQQGQAAREQADAAQQQAEAARRQAYAAQQQVAAMQQQVQIQQQQLEMQQMRFELELERQRLEIAKLRQQQVVPQPSNTSRGQDPNRIVPQGVYLNSEVSLDNGTKRCTFDNGLKRVIPEDANCWKK